MQINRSFSQKKTLAQHLARNAYLSIVRSAYQKMVLTELVAILYEDTRKWCRINADTHIASLRFSVKFCLVQCNSALKNHRVATCKSEMQIPSRAARKILCGKPGFPWKRGRREKYHSLRGAAAVQAFMNHTAAVLRMTQQKLLARDPSADITDRAKQCAVHHTGRCAIAHRSKTYQAQFPFNRIKTRERKEWHHTY